MVEVLSGSSSALGALAVAVAGLLKGETMKTLLVVLILAVAASPLSEQHLQLDPENKFRENRCK
jgi:hypothetical protein